MGGDKTTRRRCRGRVFLLVCLLLLCVGEPAWSLGAGKQLREYGRQSWQSDTGLPQNTVHALAQTRDGFLWIGTESGLVRFDGIDFAVYSAVNTAALHSGFISSLQRDAEGALWIGTADGLVRERGGVFTAYGRKQGLPDAMVLALYLTQRGRLLVLTPGGVAAFDGGGFVTVDGTAKLGLTQGVSMVAEDAAGRVWLAGLEGIASIDRGATKATKAMPVSDVGEMHALAVDADGRVWAGGSNGLAVIRDSSQAELTPRASLPSGEVTSLLPGPKGDMWIGTSKGLAVASGGAIHTVPELAGKLVERLFMDRAGTLWVATSEGLMRITHGSVDHAAPKHVVNGVLSILEDREGNMWFGTDVAGLHVLRDQAFSTITPEDGLSAPLVRAVFEDHSGTMWIGTSGGGLDKIGGLPGVQEKPGEDAEWVGHFTGKLPSRVVLALAETDSSAAHDHSKATHDLWVGTPEGLVRVRGGETKLFTTADGLADDFVRSLYADGDQSLWIGTRNGLSHYRGGSFRSYSKLDGLASDLVGTVLRGRNGELWVGTLAGLSRADGDGFSKVSAELDGAITALLEDHAGSLWIGMNGRGLSRLRGGEVASYAVAGLPETIYGMLEDGAGNLWLSSRTGVDRVSIAALESYRAKGRTATVTHYSSADGMRISEASGGGHPAAWRARDGGLWFATLDGAAVVHPSASVRNAVAPLSAIEQVLIDDQPAQQQAEEAAIRVPHGQGRISIKYAGLSFVSPQRVIYRYMLQGFDKSWVEAGTRRTAYYTNVPPGSYKFLVGCANSDGVWSVANAEQRFVVEPFFYQTGWFYVAVALALAGLGYLGYRWRVLTVEAQYDAVLEERSRIAREIHDTLAQGYVAVAVQLELAEVLLANSAEAAMQQIRQTKELVRVGLAEARSSIWNLRAQTDAEALPSLLATYVATMARRHKSVIKFTVHGAYRPLKRSVEEETFRIAQQAVANAVTHARAESIRVMLDYGGQWLQLCVTDDGVGMMADESNHAPGGHFGLQGMRERAARIEAPLEIVSAPGCGVTITLRVDMQRAARADLQRAAREDAS